MAVNEELGALFGGFIVNAKDIDAMHDMSVPTYQVGAVFKHRGPQRPLLETVESKAENILRHYADRSRTPGIGSAN